MRTAYLDLLEKRGFRIQNHTVDSDASSPRICFQFSEKLRKGRFDYAPFIRQRGLPSHPSPSMMSRSVSMVSNMVSATALRCVMACLPIPILVKAC